MPAPTKEQQIAEATDRGGRGETPLEGAGVNADLALDSATPPVAENLGRDADGAPVVPPDRRRVDPRDAIVARFRDKRGASDADEDAAQIRAFAQQGMPPEIQEREEVQPGTTEELEPETPVATEPARRTVKVRGQEVTLTEDELVAAAQRGLAGDNYLDEARSKLDRVNELIRQTEQGVRQPVRAHPAGEGTETPENLNGEHPAQEEDPYVVTMRDMQFKTPEEAAVSLRALVTTEVTKAAGQAAGAKLESTRKSEELARNNRVLETFKTEHPEIAKDPRAVAAITADIAVMQRADLVGLGVPAAEIPNDAKTLAQWHLYYRHEGFKVRPMEDLIKKGIEGFREWKGETPEVPATRRQAPTVVLTPQREARRATIPQQPSRAVTPRPDAQRQQQQPRSRSAVVAEMQANHAARKQGIRVPGR